MKFFYKKGVFGISYGKKGLFSSPSKIEFEMVSSFNDNEKDDSKESYDEKLNNKTRKININIKI